MRRQLTFGLTLLLALAALVLPPCSDGARSLMREIDLTSTYLQAIGRARAPAAVPAAAAAGRLEP